MFGVTCTACSGGRQDCEVCGGSGVRSYRRCPAKVIDRETSELLGMYRDYTRGFWPLHGGREDQPRLFLWWVGIIESERVAIEEKKHRKGADNDIVESQRRALEALQRGG